MQLVKVDFRDCSRSGSSPSCNTPLGPKLQGLCPLTVYVLRNAHNIPPKNKAKQRVKLKNPPKAKRSASSNRSPRAFASRLAERRIRRADASAKARAL